MDANWTPGSLGLWARSSKHQIRARRMQHEGEATSKGGEIRLHSGQCMCVRLHLCSRLHDTHSVCVCVYVCVCV